MLNIETLTRGEKLRMMEAIWDDLAHSTVAVSSPSWHEGELKKTERAYQDKQAEMVAWEAAKKALRDGAV